jgi:ubiquinone/menaquinone biosynthesis C-methylase UbiE
MGHLPDGSSARTADTAAMSNIDSFQDVSVQVAETYEACFVPALFAGLADHLVESAAIAPGQRVLDVACGTGIVARTAAERVGPTGAVVGLDLNGGMLTVARRLRSDLEWHQGDATSLPFPDESFDVALCQSGLMFVPDAGRAIAEMARVVVSGGTVAVQVWSALERQRGALPLAEVVGRHAGQDAVDLIGTYFRLGDQEALARLCRAAGLTVTDVHTMPVTLHAASIDDYVTTEVESTPLLSRLSEETYEQIRADARTALAPFCDEKGALALPLEVYLVTTSK